MVTDAELKARLERGDAVSLLAVLTAWQFHLKRIPGSLRFTTLDEVKELLHPEKEIVVYCTGYPSLNSSWAQRLLTENGYGNVRLYAGGLTDWERCGYPLEGEAVTGRGE